MSATLLFTSILRESHSPRQFLAEPLIDSGLRRLSLWESASFDFASLRSGRTGQLFRVSLLHSPAAAPVPTPPSGHSPLEGVGETRASARSRAGGRKPAAGIRRSGIRHSQPLRPAHPRHSRESGNPRTHRAVANPSSTLPAPWGRRSFRRRPGPASHRPQGR